MIRKFRTYDRSLQLYGLCKEARLPHHLKDQLVRASSSICLNLAEGSAKPTLKDRLKFYHVALGSCREVQAVIQMEPRLLTGLQASADILGAHLYRLCRQ